jgi:predicted DNA-binding protein (UPF0251 family)
MATKDYSNQVFGSLTAISPINKINSSGSVYWKFQCVCGNICEKPAAVVKRAVQLTKHPESPSCGCKLSQIFSATAKKHMTVHGLSNHKLYAVHRAIIARCYCSTNKSYKDYGAKGVTVCDEWKNSALNFIHWALANGWSEGKEIDKDTKISGNKVYSPETCRVISKLENSRHSHSRTTAFGKSKHILLSTEDVNNILSLYSTNKYSQYELAAKFNVSRSAIQKLVNTAKISRTFQSSLEDA